MSVRFPIQPAYLIVALVMLLSPSSFADAAFWGCFYGPPQTLRAGPVECRQEVTDCKKMILTCTRGSQQLFTVNDFADFIAVSDNGNFVVGLSNRGMGNLFWIRDDKGRLVQRRTDYYSLHYWPGVHYCSMSVTNVREWFDAKHPDVRFRFANTKLRQIIVRGCDGKEVPLL